MGSFRDFQAKRDAAASLTMVGTALVCTSLVWLGLSLCSPSGSNGWLAYAIGPVTLVVGAPMLAMGLKYASQARLAARKGIDETCAQGANEAVDLSFWARQVPWMGTAGCALAPINVVADALMAMGNDVITPFEFIWGLEVVWAVFATGLLFSRPAQSQHPGYRLGLAIGLATWVAPIIVATVAGVARYL